MTEPDKTIPARSEHAVYRIVNDEAVIVEPAKGMVNVVNDVGTRVWELVDGRRTARQIAEAICAEYEVSSDEALADVAAFLTDLEEKGLVTCAVAARV